MNGRRLLLGAAGAVAVVLGIAWLPRSGQRPGSRERPGTRDPPAAPSPSPHAPAAPWRAAARVPVVEEPVPPAPPAPDPSARLDPRHPDYNAVWWYESRGRDVLDLFAGEPRDEAWAQEREGDIVSQALPELQDADRDVRVEVECRTATCRVRVYSWKPMLTEESSFYPLTCLSSTTVPEWGTVEGSPDAIPYSDFYMIFGPDTRGRAGFLSRRDGTCARYRDEWRQRVLR